MNYLYLADAETGKLLYGYPERQTHECFRHWIFVVNLRDLAPFYTYFEVVTNLGVLAYFVDYNLLLIADFHYRMPPSGFYQFSFADSIFEQLSRLVSAAFVQQFFQVSGQRDAFRRRAPGAKTYSKFTPSAFASMNYRLSDMVQARYFLYDGQQLRRNGQILPLRRAYLPIFRLMYQNTTVVFTVGQRRIYPHKIGDCIVFVEFLAQDPAPEVVLLRTLLEVWY